MKQLAVIYGVIGTMSLVGGRRAALACILLLQYVTGAQVDEDHRYLSLNEGDTCVQDSTGAAGVCTPLNKCPSATADLKSGLKPATCAYEGRWTVVCCARDDTPARDPPPPVPTVLAKSTTRVADSKCEDYKLPIWNYAAYVVGGTLANAHEFSHMAALGWRTQTGNMMFLCGGSLISERFVLTAAHCLVAPRHHELADQAPAIVRLGVLVLNSSLAAAKGQLDMPIKNRVPHPSYASPAKYFDIALLELAAEVPFTEHHRPACLWTRHDLAPHTKATVTGWGTTTNRGRDNSPGLMKVDVDLFDSRLCDHLLGSLSSRNWQGFQEHQLCAGVLAGGRDACQGDSGGPLQVIIESIPKNQYSVIGLTSFGWQCGLPNQPGIYTRVSSFLDWIEPIVWPEYNLAHYY